MRRISVTPLRRVRATLRRELAWLLLSAACALPASADTVVFSEDFGTVDWESPASRSCDPDFPAGWTRHNQDGFTPDAQVNWVDDAWVVSGIWSDTVGNCVAFSTSYYSPANAADDWLVTPAITVPAIHPRLRFRARAQDAAYPDGYEVRWATSNGVADLLLNAPLLTVAAESSTWNAREVDLSALAGQTVHFAFRNNSSDKFLLLLDDVQVASVPVHDALISATLRPHANLLHLPLSQAIPLQLGATVRNGGANTITNVVVTARVLLDGVEVHSAQAATVPGLAAGATTDVSMSAYTVTAAGTVTVQYSVAIAETDDDPGNDAMTSASLQSTAWEMGGDDGIYVTSVGIGATDGGQLGTHYHLTQPGWVHAIRYYASATNDELAGVAVVGEIRSMSAGKPDALLAQTQAYTVPAPPVAGFVDLPLAAPVLLPAGDYYFGLIEPPPPPGLSGNLDLGMSATLYQAGRNWVRFTPDSPDWSLMETHSGGLFARATMLRVLFGPADTTPPAITAGPTVTPVAGGTTASASVTVNESATGYWQVLPATAAAPSGADLQTGGTPVAMTGAVAVAIPITGLVPGTAYRFHFIARDVANNVQASVTSVHFVVPVDTSALPLPGQPGETAQASVTGGGSTCAFSSAAFISPVSLPAPPAHVTPVADLFEFVLDGCTPGSTVQITLTYPQALPAAPESGQLRFWKYGPRPGQAAGWYAYPHAIINGNTVTLTLTDGALGDDDLDAGNGRIVDAGGPMHALIGAVAVPTLSQWGVLLLATLLAGIAGLQRWLGNRGQPSKERRR